MQESDLLNQQITENPPKRGLLFCPYCQTWSAVKASKEGYKVLECCGISIKDFYVRRLNHLWR